LWGIDERIALITLHDPVIGQSSLTCLVIEHTSMAKALKLAFESLWVQGVDFERRFPCHTPDQPDALGPSHGK
jgi:hypothetical protein